MKLHKQNDNFFSIKVDYNQLKYQFEIIYSLNRNISHNSCLM
ncbi:hypothetical protein M083_2603 [Bacteroides fragilis str. 3986 T(B)9]|uniref:Uncharacterized protein n=2 Tax=Bacteroides fragilis TaxID=817 RepID=A0AAN4SJ29_BACFG|nr:hypothetical protein M083_2603 [Bacteroides fragilis str. 3986 T(B)9]EXY83949.1 hypothetical protein M079_2887 [Bacteroides fragilis str. 3996 N(B) 6]EXZ04971.1 hypothetical protein M072_2623 [Bacteroides fragilis str. DS-208]EXZ57452.1 hypothetical protein M116_2914 [Bacteroides fragilis str. 3719 A10]EXZ62659.1 hypothetical protein M107_2976 [Bacteroides fragilis str. 3725 D9(v)]EXZ67443.1 hypothetical protein M120_3046 [Bacteroides fragilis str. 3783N1-8]EXZ77951.1 hypothetical protein 